MKNTPEKQSKHEDSADEPTRCDGPCVSVKELWELMDSLDRHAFSNDREAHIHPAYGNGIRAALDEIENGFNLRVVMEEAGLLQSQKQQLAAIRREADQ